MNFELNFAVVVFIVEPGQPSEVNVYAFAKYILVTWEPPLEPNGIITKYRVGSAVNTGSEDVVVDKEEVGNSVRRNCWKTRNLKKTTLWKYRQRQVKDGEKLRRRLQQLSSCLVSCLTVTFLKALKLDIGKASMPQVGRGMHSA